MKLGQGVFGLLLPALMGCAQAHVPVDKPPPHETFSIQSRHMNESRSITVYLPPGYAPEGAGGDYPTLYLLDGGMQQDFPRMAQALDAGIRAGSVRPMLLVGIENPRRRRDMTGTVALRAFIAGELIPAIESRYRVDASRGIIGQSEAGLFVVETLFLQPGLFDTHIALSPSLWRNDARLVKGAKARMAAQPALRGRLYLSSANEQNIVPHVAALAAVLAGDAPKGLYWTVKPRPDLRHENIYRSLAPQLLVDYYGAVTAQDAAVVEPVRRDGAPTVETK